MAAKSPLPILRAAVPKVVVSPGTDTPDSDANPDSDPDASPDRDPGATPASDAAPGNDVISFSDATPDSDADATPDSDVSREPDPSPCRDSNLDPGATSGTSAEKNAAAAAAGVLSALRAPAEP